MTELACKLDKKARGGWRDASKTKRNNKPEYQTLLHRNIIRNGKATARSNTLLLSSCELAESCCSFIAFPGESAATAMPSTREPERVSDTRFLASPVTSQLFGKCRSDRVMYETISSCEPLKAYGTMTSKKE